MKAGVATHSHVYPAQQAGRLCRKSLHLLPLGHVARHCVDLGKRRKEVECV